MEASIIGTHHWFRSMLKAEECKRKVEERNFVIG